MGCITRIGCLVLLALLAAAAWFTRDHWMGLIRDRDDATATAAVTWQPLTDAAAERGRRAVESLGQSGGPVFVNLTGAELASYAVEQLARQLPSADSIEAMVEADRLSMRASVKLGELGGSGMLGPLAGMLGDRERLKLSGTLRVVRPGLGEFDVKEASLRDFRVPVGMIPRIMARVARRRPEGVAPSALPLTIPRHVGDVRLANGRVTLYKANQ
jgi:hypothetical protein